MISSRVQFGVYGAVIPIVLVCLMYVGFSASGSVLAGQAIGQLLHVSDSSGILIFAAMIVLLTDSRLPDHPLDRSLVEHDWRASLFSTCSIRLLSQHDIGLLLGNRHFSLSSFLLAISLSASWQIAFGPYVADYSRYLPGRTSALKTFLAVGLGSVIGSQISMVFGVFVAALAGDQFAGHEVSYIVGLGASGAWRRCCISAWCSAR